VFRTLNYYNNQKKNNVVDIGAHKG